MSKKNKRRKKTSFKEARAVASLVDQLCDGEFTSEAAMHLAQVFELCYMAHVLPLLDQAKAQGEMAFWPENVVATRDALHAARVAEWGSDDEYMASLAYEIQNYSEPS